MQCTVQRTNAGSKVDCTCTSADTKAKYMCPNPNICPWATCCSNASCFYQTGDATGVYLCSCVCPCACAKVCVRACVRSRVRVFLCERLGLRLMSR